MGGWNLGKGAGLWRGRGLVLRYYVWGRVTWIQNSIMHM